MEVCFSLSLMKLASHVKTLAMSDLILLLL